MNFNLNTKNVDADTKKQFLTHPVFDFAFI